MPYPYDQTQPAAADGSEPRSGRYRFCAGEPVNPLDGLHPEVAEFETHSPAVAGIPNSPNELIAMQDQMSSKRPEKPERQTSAKVTQVMELIDKLDTKGAEDLAIAFRLVRRLEGFHDEVVDDMRTDEQASHNQLISWAIDADRLMQARILLGNVDLE